MPCTNISSIPRLQRWSPLYRSPWTKKEKLYLREPGTAERCHRFFPGTRTSGRTGRLRPTCPEKCPPDFLTDSIFLNIKIARAVLLLICQHGLDRAIPEAVSKRRTYESLKTGIGFGMSFLTADIEMDAAGIRLFRCWEETGVLLLHEKSCLLQQLFLYLKRRTYYRSWNGLFLQFYPTS